jgi:arylsulfatase A-like enzyme
MRLVKRTRLVLAAAVVALVAGAAVLVGRSHAEHRPSVLVVLWDTVRADRMSLYGHDRPTTPGLEAFARDAAVYDLAISPAMWTVPSHASLFTGLPASSHGAKVGWLWLDGHHVTMAEHFGANGFATFAWSTNPFLSEATNLLQGFETVRYAWRGEDGPVAAAATRAKLLPEDASTELSPAFHGVGQGWPEHLTLAKDSAPIAGESFLSWVDALPEGEPFFAYLNFLEAHHPRIPSLEARRAVAPDLVERSLATDASLFRVMAAMEGKAHVSPEDVEAMAATYDATLWDLDRATTAIVDGLRARGRLDDTIVVITSDHGENLGEHGMWEHRWDLHQSLVHVPLVIRGPGVPAGRVARPVSTAHLFGTLLGLTGVAPPDVPQPLPPIGSEERVFTELVAPTKRIPDVEAAFPGLPKDRWQTHWQAVVDGTLKLLRPSAGDPQLFDVVADPGEAEDLTVTRAGDAERLLGVLKEWNAEKPRYDKRQRTAEDRPGNPLAADPSVSSQLEALGYADGLGEEAP